MPTASGLHHRQTGLCPTLAQPSQQRDGLLLRVPLLAGRLTANQLDALADVAQASGNGVIELTNRGNLQLRGFDSSGIVAALRRCADEGLAEPTNRLLTISCFAGPAEVALRERILAGLADLATTGLSAKFVVHVDDRHGTSFRPSADLNVALGKDPNDANDGNCNVEVAGRRLHCPPQDIAPLTRQLADACRQQGPRARVADLDPVQLDALLGPLTTRLDSPIRPVAVGLGVVALGSSSWALAGVRFGRTTPAQLSSLADVLRDERLPWVAVTPWRSWALPGTDAAHAASLYRRLLGSGWLSSTDPGAHVVVCVGARGCWQTELDTLAFAEGLVAHRHNDGAPQDVHISGCDKRCATRQATTVTFVGRSDSTGFDRLAGAA